MVEVGYAIDPAYRRQGYARAALAALLERAAREPAVTHRAGERTAGQRGLERAGRLLRVRRGGQQWDEEDGLETVYERPA